MVPLDSNHRVNFELFIKVKAPSPLDPLSNLPTPLWYLFQEWYACIVSISPWLSKQAMQLHSRPALAKNALSEKALPGK